MQDYLELYFRSAKDKATPLARYISQQHNSIAINHAIQQHISEHPSPNNNLHTSHLQHNHHDIYQYNRQYRNRSKEITQKLTHELTALKIRKYELQSLAQQTNTNLQRLMIEIQIKGIIRKEQGLLRQYSQQMQENDSKAVEQANKIQEKQSRRRAIEERLRGMDKAKSERLSILSAKNIKIIPKYKLIEKEFMLNEISKEIESNLQAKSQREKKSPNYLRYLRRDKGLSGQPQRVKSEASLGLKQKKQILRERRQLVKGLSQRIKSKKVKISLEKTLMADIAKDKALNPFKYNYLKLKKLTEQQIFSEFQDFEIEFNTKGIGDQYLEQSKLLAKKHYQRNIKKSDNQGKANQTKKQKTKSQPIHTRRTKPSQSHIDNNMPPIKHRMPTEHPSDTRFDRQPHIMLRKSENKSQVLEKLSSQVAIKQIKMKRMATEVECEPKRYHQYLRIEQNIDEDYLQFLKTKIVSLEVKVKP